MYTGRGGRAPKLAPLRRKKKGRKKKKTQKKEPKQHTAKQEEQREYQNRIHGRGRVEHVSRGGTELVDFAVGQERFIL